MAVIFKCKMCGGDLNIEEGALICECEYCGTSQTVPALDNEKKINLFTRANRLRFNNEFDAAAGVFESIVSEFPDEAEAYWGLCLCKFGIEYVDDPATAKKIPTCHRTSFDSIFDDENFEQACENADAIARRLYRDEAKEIDRLQKAILNIAKNEAPYDIFICYKETAPSGERTLDSVRAQDMYDALTEKGYKVFFARITLEDKLGQEYEPYIFSALSTAKIMLAVGTDYEYFNATWVKNEWGRFLDMMKRDKSKVLIPCYEGIDAYDMPKEFKNLQAQDMGKVGFMQDLIRGIGKILRPVEEKAVPEQQTSTKYTDSDVEKMISSAVTAAMKQAQQQVSLDTSKYPDFEWDGTEIKYYKGKGGAINIPSGTTTIGKQAFWACTGLTSITIPDSVTSIGGAAFYCHGLTSITIPDSIADLKNPGCDFVISENNPNYAFAGNALFTRDMKHLIALKDKQIETYVIPDGVTSVCEYAFLGCTGLTSITIPDSVTSIGESAFRFCTSLTSITIPDGVTSVCEYAFLGCTGLTSITIPNSVTSIGEWAFSKCTGLTSITIPDSVISIGENAFSGCTGLISITIPNSVTSIGEWAFSGCTGLTSITIPGSVTSIGGRAFSGCTGLTSIAVPKKNLEKYTKMVRDGDFGTDIKNVPVVEYLTEEERRVREEEERRKAEEEKRRKAEEEQRKQEEARRRALEDERRRQIEEANRRRAALTAEKAALETELAGLRGLFTGKRRSELEQHIHQLEIELSKHQ